MNRKKADKALLESDWYHMAEAPKFVMIEVFCPSKEGLSAMLTTVIWHESAGFCVDELREPTMWRFI